MKAQSIILLLVCMMLQSCALFSDEEQALNAHIKFPFQRHEGDAPVMTDGLYMSEDSCVAYWFAPDGGCYYLFLQSFPYINGYRSYICIRPEEIQEDMTKAISRRGADTTTLLGCYKYGVWKWGNSGAYELDGDTIRAVIYSQRFLIAPLSMEQRNIKFVWRDSTTIDDVYEKGAYQYINTMYLPVRFHYIPVNNLPSPDAKIRFKKWLWHDPAEWKAYKKRVKAKRKQMRREERREWKKEIKQNYSVRQR